MQISCWLGHVPDHKWLHYIAFKLDAEENSVAMPNKPTNQYYMRSRESTALIKGLL